MIWGPVNFLAVSTCFRRMQVTGLSEIPKQGAFLLVCNHVSRWDGLIVQKLIGRPANFMVSPHELSGLQGKVLRSMGAFPADSRYDLTSFAKRQAAKGEALVVFPEGDIYRTGSTQRFRSGAARLALSCAANGIRLPIIPMAISYPDEQTVEVSIGESIDVSDYQQECNRAEGSAIHVLTTRLQREVSFLRRNLGQERDTLSLYDQKPNLRWVSRRRAT